jgi:hypothetical protein
MRQFIDIYRDRRCKIYKKTKVLANRSDKKVVAEKKYGLKGGKPIAWRPKKGNLRR